MTRGIVAIIAAPIVWGLVRVPANQLILSFFPETDAGNFSTTVLIVSVVASFVYSIIAGMAATLLAPQGFSRIGLYAGLAVLLVGLGVQIGSWSMFPVWYHLVFLAALLPLCWVGSLLARKLRGSTV